jgi:hypothetical protein
MKPIVPGGESDVLRENWVLNCSGCVVMALSPSCAEKRALADRFFWAVSEYHRIQSAHVAALRNGDAPFEDELKRAHEVREAATEALLSHQRAHGC